MSIRAGGVAGGRAAADDQGPRPRLRRASRSRAHIFDFEGDLYGEWVRSPGLRLREGDRFESRRIEKQLQHDVPGTGGPSRPSHSQPRLQHLREYDSDV